MKKMVSAAVMLMTLIVFLSVQKGICQSEARDANTVSLSQKLEQVLQNQAQILAQNPGSLYQAFLQLLQPF